MSTKGKTSEMLFKALGIFAVVFGLATIKEGGSVLFFNGEARAEAGNYVPFVLIFNFVAGFFYVLAGLGIILKKKWAGHLALILATTSGITFGFFGLHIYNQQPYETRTVFAMTIRTGFWLFASLILYRAGLFSCPLCPAKSK